MSAPLARVGLLGGGVIGGGWAGRFLAHGVDVLLYDPDPEAGAEAARVVDVARRAMERLFDAPLPPPGSLYVVATPEDAASDVDFVQESAPERLELKRTLLDRADAVAGPDVVIASSTSGLRPSELQAGLRHPQRLVVGHPFNPVYLLPLVEVCGGAATAPVAVERVADVYRAVGMHPLVLTTEVDGFVADRLLEALWREALWLVHDGVATTAQIDDAIRFGAGLRWSAMGTFLVYRLAGGRAGMRHFIEQFGPALHWPWTKLTDVPELTPALVDRIVAQSDEQAAGQSVDELMIRRDDCLVAVMRALADVGWGAGETVARHRRQLRERAANDDQRLVVTFDDGHRVELHHLWLRDNCTCGECRHPQTTERTLDSFALDPGVAPVEVDRSGETVAVTWSDGHRSEYDMSWLRANGPGTRPQPDDPPAPRPWRAEIAGRLPEVAYADVVDGDDGLLRLLDAVLVDGFAIVRGVPTDEDALADLARRAGHLRETNFGVLWSVRTKAEPNNVAYTSVELRPHTDLPNRETPPGVQFLLCRAADAPGGHTTLVDGFAVAEQLRTADPTTFERLCSVPIPYRFHDDDHDLRWVAPVIALEGDGALREIRFHDALMAPFDLPIDEVASTYDALRCFHRLANDDSYRVILRLAPGDLLVFDNRRVLHGRTAFDAQQGRRHLIGCYVDGDEWRSRRRVIARRPSPT